MRRDRVSLQPLHAPTAVKAAVAIFRSEDLAVPEHGSGAAQGDRVARLECREISDDSVFGKVGLDCDQSAIAAPPRSEPVDALGKFAVTHDPPAAQKQRRPVAPRSQTCNTERRHRKFA